MGNLTCLNISRVGVADPPDEAPEGCRAIAVRNRTAATRDAAAGALAALEPLAVHLLAVPAVAVNKGTC